MSFSDGPALHTVEYLKPQRALSMPGALYINKQGVTLSLLCNAGLSAAGGCRLVLKKSVY